MFTKSNTRIILIDGRVVILRQISQIKTKCRIFIDGIEKGHLVEANGLFVAEDNSSIEPIVLLKINDLAKRAKVA